MAARGSAHRARLLTGGALSNADIASLRHIDERSARLLVASEEDRFRLFTVRHAGDTLVPRFLLDADGEPTEVCRAVEVLVPLGLNGWGLWSWLASPSGWLSGEVPAEVFITDPDRAMAGVRAYASELVVTADL